MPDLHEFDKTYKTKVIKAGEVYSETWNIEKNARENYTGPPGKYELNKAGNYMICACASTDGSVSGIEASEFRITIKE